MFARYGSYLETQGGSAFQERLFSIIECEDTPRSVEFQMQLLQKSDLSMGLFYIKTHALPHSEE